MVFNRRKWQVVEETRGDNATVVIRGWADSRGWSSGDISEMVYLMDRLWTSAIQCYLRSSLMLYIQDQRTVSIYMNAINYGDWQITVTYNPVYARRIPVLNLLDPQWIVYSSVYSVLQLTLTKWRRACRNKPSRPNKMRWTCHERSIQSLPGKGASARGQQDRTGCMGGVRLKAKGGKGMHSVYEYRQVSQDKGDIIDIIWIL